MRMNSARTASLIITLVLTFSSVVQDRRAQTRPGAGSSQIEAVSAWLAESAIPLKVLEAGNGFDDLQQLKPILKDVRIVGLGEGTHGTHEFFQLKHRLLEFLVRGMGFTLLVMEGGYASSLPINDYVLSGTGDLSRILATYGAWPWDTKEVRDMIEWMRDFNKTVPEKRKVKFLGYDPDSDKYGGEVVTSYLKRVAPGKVGFAERAMRPVLSEPVRDLDLAVLLADNGRPGRSDHQKRMIRQRLDELSKYLASRRVEFMKKTSVIEFERVLHCVRTIAQYNEIFGRPWVNSSDPTTSGIAVRDIRTSENVKRLLDSQEPGTRMMLWAHNGHIATGPILPSIPSLGSYLRRTFGRAYYAVGFGFDRGSFQARNLDQDDSQFGAVVNFEIASAPQDSVEWFLARPGLRNYFVDLRYVSRGGAVVEWLNSPREMRHLLGAGYSVKWPPSVYTRRIAPREYYDGLVFVEKTMRAQPNPSGVRGPLQRASR